VFAIGLSAQKRRDLVAYLTAVGDGVQPYEHQGVGAVLKELNDFAVVLGTAIAAGPGSELRGEPWSEAARGMGRSIPPRGG
jgi:hypothetical protein